MDYFCSQGRMLHGVTFFRHVCCCGSCSAPSAGWKQKYSLLTGANDHVTAPPRWQLNLSCQRSRARAPVDFKCEVIKFIYLFFCLVLFNIEVPNYIIKFTCCCCSCIVLYCFSSFFSGTFLITSNNSFCLTFFLFSLRLLLHAAVCCVCVFFLCTVLLFTVSCLLGQFHVFVCYYLFSLLGSECKNRKRPLNVLLIQMICLFCTSFFCLLFC